MQSVFLSGVGRTRMVMVGFLPVHMLRLHIVKTVKLR